MGFSSCNLREVHHLRCLWPRLPQRKTKGQQLKGKIVFIIFGTFSHFFTLLHNFSPGTFFPSKQGVLAQGEQKRRKDNKKKRANRFCTLVVARLSSSYFHPAAAIRIVQCRIYHSSEASTGSKEHVYGIRAEECTVSECKGS